MWVSRPGLGLETDQDHFLRSWSWSWCWSWPPWSWSWSWSRPCWSWSWSWSRPPWSWSRSWSRPVWSWSWSRRVVLSKTWGYEQPQRYLCRKSKLASECDQLFTYLLFDRPISMFLCIITFTAVQCSNVDEWKLFVCAGRDRDSKGFGLGLGCWSWSRPCWSWSWSWSRSRSWPVWSWSGLGLARGLPGLDNISGLWRAYSRAS